MRKSGGQPQEHEAQPLYVRSVLLAHSFSWHACLLSSSAKRCESSQQVGSLVGEISCGLSCGRCSLSDVPFPIESSDVTMWLPRRPRIIRKGEGITKVSQKGSHWKEPRVQGSGIG